ncbi:MAG: response regulator [Pyrinomonadaceae bacterium]
MISGHRLLIADDSLTIQKVVDLTFSDEGMLVTSVGDGDEAVARLEEVAPDVVLADVLMPGLNGYQVCEAIKHSERFRHIPVMLLVGSFEPFDEAEARRVGADDVLTKPFQSIRQLVNRVGTLLGGKAAGGEEVSSGEAPTEELSPGLVARLAQEAGSSEGNQEAARDGEAIAEQSPDEVMSTAEIELTTADTLPLVEIESKPGYDDVMQGKAGGSAADVSAPSAGNTASDQDRAYWAARLANESEPAKQDEKSKQHLRVEPMEKTSDQRRATSSVDDFDDLLLDLGDLDSVRAPVSLGDSVLELGDEEPEPVAYATESFGSSAMSQSASDHIPYATAVEPEWLDASSGQSAQPSAGSEQDLGAWAIVPPPAQFERVTDSRAALADQTALHKQQDSYGESTAAKTSDSAWAGTSEMPARAESAPQSSQRLSPEDIDAIARRVVEHLSEKAVREIAWEVVPELAELMIKRRLEET